MHPPGLQFAARRHGSHSNFDSKKLSFRPCIAQKRETPHVNTPDAACAGLTGPAPRPAKWLAGELRGGLCSQPYLLFSATCRRTREIRSKSPATDEHVSAEVRWPSRRCSPSLLHALPARASLFNNAHVEFMPRVVEGNSAV
jgi:hypothetical protein